MQGISFDDLNRKLPSFFLFIYENRYSGTFVKLPFSFGLGVLMMMSPRTHSCFWINCQTIGWYASFYPHKTSESHVKVERDNFKIIGPDKDQYLVQLKESIIINTPRSKRKMQFDERAATPVLIDN